MHDASVVIRGDRITAISHSKSAAAPGGESNVEVIDGTGLYLSPGLIDSHVHNCSHLHKGHPDSEPATNSAVRAGWIPRDSRVGL
jgi:imidazolonepropionase-like amidohydrolase